jgi:hypothetical protein
MTRSMVRWLGAPALAAALLGGLLASPAAAADPVTEEQLLERIEKAGTADDHAALAAYYREQAQAREARAAEHDEMAAKYASYKVKGDWATHCRNLAASARKEAEEFGRLAAMHEEHSAALRAP